MSARQVVVHHDPGLKRPSRQLDFQGKRGAISQEGEVSLTVQSEKEACDINNILAKYQKTGMLPDLIRQEPMYGDFVMPVDYQEAIAIVEHANTQFAALDAHVRDRFENDPEAFLAFCQDPQNVDEMEKLGLLKPEVVEKRKADRLAADIAAGKAASSALSAGSGGSATPTSPASPG